MLKDNKKVTLPLQNLNEMVISNTKARNKLSNVGLFASVENPTLGTRQSRLGLIDLIEKKNEHWNKTEQYGLFASVKMSTREQNRKICESLTNKRQYFCST